MLEKLKQFDADRATLEEMLALRAFGKQLRAEYEAESLEVPAWLSEKLNALSTAVASNLADWKAKRLVELDQAEAGLMTAAEKREKIRLEREKLLAK